MKKRDLQDVLNGSEFVAQRRAFRKNLPFAISKDGHVILVYADGHTEKATDDRITELCNRLNVSG